METILLTEDDVALRAQLRFALEERFEVLEAGDVRKAINLLGKHEVTLAVLDLGLPPHENTPDEGLRLLHYVLENFGIKVIILTGQKTESAARPSRASRETGGAIVIDNEVSRKGPRKETTDERRGGPWPSGDSRRPGRHIQRPVVAGWWR